MRVLNGEFMFKTMKQYLNAIKEGKLQDVKLRLKWIYSYGRPHLRGVVIYTLLGLSGTVISLFGSLVSRDLVDIITGHRTGELVMTFCIMLGVTLGNTLIGQVSAYISTKINLKIDNEMKAAVFDEIMITDWESLTKYHSGDLLVRWNSDVSMVSSAILSLIPNIIIIGFKFISALWMVVNYDASFAIFALASVPVSLLASYGATKSMRKSNMNSMEINAKLSSFNQETFSNVQTVKAFDMVPKYSKRLRELQKEYTKVRLKYQKASILSAMILLLVSMLTTYSAQGWGIYKVWSGAITYGTMTMFISLSSTLTGTVNSLISLIPSTIGLLNAAKRLMDITEMPKEDYSAKDEVRAFFEEHREEGIGVSIRNAAYAYNVGGNDVFTGVNADAHPHETIAFVGPSGEGKTTMMRLILSIINAREGSGYICAGNSTPESSREGGLTEKMCIPLSASTRQLFAYVPQGNTMFSGTIAENMRNVKEDATDEEIIDALKLACAWSFVEKLPDGINSEIKEHGGGFSEGQAQRLSIARALLRKSPVLLLDEATSALDIATEREVLKRIMQDDYPRTCIVTTHRPTVLNICNRVYAIRNKSCDLLDAEEVERMISDF